MLVTGRSWYHPSEIRAATAIVMRFSGGLGGRQSADLSSTLDSVEVAIRTETFGGG
jgi:hypothetical protein